MALNVQQISLRTDPEAVRKWIEIKEEWDKNKEERRKAKFAARIHIQRGIYERALQPVIVQYPEPTGDSLQDEHDRMYAELKAKDQEQINAGTRYRYEHGAPV